MRDIKFRVWDKGKSDWINPKDVNIYTEFSKDNKCNFFVGGIADSGIILSEYTGLNDEDSNPIYEGDIVDFYEEEIGYSRGKICFEAGMFIIACDKFEDSYKGLDSFGGKSDVQKV